MNANLSTRNSGQAGFTLVEVLIALTILATALLVLLDAHYGALSLYDAARLETVERSLMRQAIGMAETEIMAGNPTGSGDFGKRYPEYRYAFDSTPVGEDPAVGLYDLLVTVEGPQNRREMHVLVYYMGTS